MRRSAYVNQWASLDGLIYFVPVTRVKLCKYRIMIERWSTPWVVMKSLGFGDNCSVDFYSTFRDEWTRCKHDRQAQKMLFHIIFFFPLFVAPSIIFEWLFISTCRSILFFILLFIYTHFSTTACLFVACASVRSILRAFITNANQMEISQSVW